ncbi:hypothetical protein KR084_012965, partial [Drosophila pseudotakahashii]
SWLLGLFPFTFDSQRKQLRRSRWLVIYGSIGHISLFCLLFQRNFESEEPNAFKRNPLMGKIHHQFGVITIFCGFFMHFMIFWGSNKVQDIANELLTLDYQDFGSLNITNCPKFNSRVIQKALAAICQSLILIAFSITQGKGFWKILEVLRCLPLLDLHLVLMRIHTEILLICRYVLFINGELVHLAYNLELDPTTKSSRIRELAALYYRLLKLHKKVVEAYNFQLTLIFTINLTYNIVLIYCLIVFGFSMNEQSIFFVVVPQIILNVWDFWLNIVVCDVTEKEAGKTLTVLKYFTDLELNDVELERSLNEFAWLCSHRKFQFQLCGLFLINYNMGFHMFITSCLHLVYLVQFDYMNL